MALWSRLSRFGMQLLSCFSKALYCSGRGVCEASRAMLDAGEDALPIFRKENGASRPQWVFLGCPGVGKGTNASQMARLFNVPHISMSDIVREEIKVAPTAEETQALLDDMTRGKLLPDDIIIELLRKRLQKDVLSGGQGFILDGFPRTIHQAHMLDVVTDIDLVVNFKMHEDIIVAKCLGRRICSHCGDNFNFANIDVEGTNGESRIILPPRLPPPACVGKMTIHPDDTAEVIRARLHVYHAETKPVEDFYKMKGKLINFNVGAGIAKTSISLLAALSLQETRRQQALSNSKLPDFPSLPPRDSIDSLSDCSSNPTC